MTTTETNLPTLTVRVKGQPITFTSAFATTDTAVEFLRSQPFTEFGDSLLHAYYSPRGASPAQAAWIHKLATDASQTTDLDLLPIVTLLHTAQAAAKKAPVIKLQAASGAPVVLRLAGDRSKRPGTVSVTDGARYGMSGRYFGTIDLDGAFHEGASCCDEVRDLLTALSENPARVAGQHGVATDSCCFCSRPLSTKESRSVGYGPDCADRYGLPWGTVSAEVEAAHVAACEPLVAPAAPAVPAPGANVLAVLHTVRRYAEARGAVGNEVLTTPVRTVSVWNEVELAGDESTFGDVLRECIRKGYLFHNGDVARDLHTTTLTAQGLQVLQIGD